MEEVPPVSVQPVEGHEGEGGQVDRNVIKHGVRWREPTVTFLWIIYVPRILIRETDIESPCELLAYFVSDLLSPYSSLR